MNEEEVGKNYVDGWSLLLYAILVTLGWLSIYSASHGTGEWAIDLSTNFGKQLLWIGLSVGLGAILFLIDVRFFDVFGYWVYGLTIFLLLLVLVFGTEVNGARAWFQIGGFRLQPAEFAKFGVALALAKYLGDIDSNVQKLKQQIIAFVVIAVPSVLIVIQGDAGSALVYGALLVMLYREGMSGVVLLLGIGAISVFIFTLAFGSFAVIVGTIVIAAIIYAFTYTNTKILPYLLVICIAISIMAVGVKVGFELILQEHQQTRLEVMLGLKDDPQGVGYNVNQSKIAIGSGGMWGKGFLNGSHTKGDFVPEQHTDFIFSTIGEEFGWFGSSIIILVFTLFFLRLSFIAERQRNKFSRVYAYSVLCMLLFHFTINIGMTINLAPVIGIPLPFFSYGGSSLIAFTLLVFLLLRLDANRFNELDSIDH
jgi:rod shape determining protein RodA